jgi:hypothetical protein
MQNHRQNYPFSLCVINNFPSLMLFLRYLLVHSLITDHGWLTSDPDNILNRFYCNKLFNCWSEQPNGLKHVLSWSHTGIVGPNSEFRIPNSNFEYLAAFIVFYVILCIDNNPEKGWSPVQGALPTFNNIQKQVTRGFHGSPMLQKGGKKLHGLSRRANYTDRATAACRRSDYQLFADRGCHVVNVTDP